MIACKTQKKSRSVAVFATALLGTVHKTSCLLFPRKRTRKWREHPSPSSPGWSRYQTSCLPRQRRVPQMRRRLIIRELADNQPVTGAEGQVPPDELASDTLEEFGNGFLTIFRLSHHTLDGI